MWFSWRCVGGIEAAGAAGTTFRNLRSAE